MPVYQHMPQICGPFKIHRSEPPVGAIHRKCLSEDMTTRDQYTLNLYVAGRFAFGPEGGEQIQIEAGTASTEIDMTLRAGVVYVERPLVAESVRLCVEPAGHRRRWRREVVTYQYGDEVDIAEDEPAIVLAGEAQREIGAPVGAGGFLVRPGRWVIMMEGTRLVRLGF